MKRIVLDVIIMTLGGLFFALGINYFILPNHLSEGGIIGITIILHYVLEWDPGIVNFILNVILIGVGYKYFDKKAMIYTIYSVSVSSLLISLTSGIDHTLTDDALLAAIFAGLLIGIGLGLVFYVGGTSGGTTVLAGIAKQLWGWSVGKALLIMDLVIIAGAVFVIGIEKAMLTLITVFIVAKVIDFIVEGLNERVAVFIISNAADEILKEVLVGMSRGVTVLDGKGGYTGTDKQVLYLVISKQEIVKLRHIMEEIDEHAYVTIHNVHELLKRGYRAEKLRKEMR